MGVTVEAGGVTSMVWEVTVWWPGGGNSWCGGVTSMVCGG